MALSSKNVGTIIHKLIVTWHDSTTSTYTDKVSEDTVPSLMSISGCNSAVRDNSIGAVENCDCVLFDSDGSLKTLVASTTIEGALAKVIIDEIDELGAVTDTVVLMSGKLTAPVIWSDNDRTLKLSITTSIKGKIVQAYEEAEVLEMEPPPYCFGTVYGVKCADSEPHYKMYTMDSIYQYRKLLGSVYYNYKQATFNVAYGDLMPQGEYMVLEIDGTLFGGTFTGTAFTATDFNKTYGSTNIQSRDENSQYYDDPSFIWCSSSEDTWRGKYAEMTVPCKAWAKTLDDSVQRIEGDPDGPAPSSDAILVTENVTQYVQIQGFDRMETSARHLKLNSPLIDMFGNQILATNGSIVSLRGKYNLSDTDIVKDESVPWAWQIPAGTPVNIYTPAKVFIANQLASTEVLGVFCIKEGIPVAIPESWYEVDLTGPTKITLNTLPTSYNWPSNDLYCSLVSSVGPNPVDVIQYLVENWVDGGLSCDSISFTAVKADYEINPCGFAITEPTSSLDVIKDLAWESMLGIRIRNNVMYLVNRAKEPATLGQIAFTDDNAVYGSYALQTTDSMDIVTEYKFRFRPTYFQSDYPRLLAVNKNTDLFGSEKMDYTFKCYNLRLPVQRALDFWSERYGNVWLQVNAKSYLREAGASVFDYYSLDCEAITAESCCILSSAYDPENELTDLAFWIPESPSGGVPFATWSGTPTPESMYITDWSIPITTSAYKRDLRLATKDGQFKDDKARDYDNLIKGNGQFKILSIHDNFLRCTPVSFGDHAVTPDGDNVVYIALPVELRRVYYETTSSARYSEALQSDAQTRTCRQVVTIWREKIMPEYKVGDIITAIYNPGGVSLTLGTYESTGYTDAQIGLIVYQDYNVVGRTWRYV